MPEPMASTSAAPSQVLRHPDLFLSRDEEVDHRRPGDRRRLPLQALQPARAGGPRQGDPAAPAAATASARPAMRSHGLVSVSPAQHRPATPGGRCRSRRLPSSKVPEAACFARPQQAIGPYALNVHVGPHRGQPHPAHPHEVRGGGRDSVIERSMASATARPLPLTRHCCSSAYLRRPPPCAGGTGRASAWSCWPSPDHPGTPLRQPRASASTRTSWSRDGSQLIAQAAVLSR
jgi:hypothetical protein